MDESQTPLLELRRACFTYPGQRDVLDNLDFCLRDKDRAGLFGPNGSGKTTLLHVIMGLLSPDSGEVLFRGSPCRCEKDFQAVRRAIGLLLQNADDQLFNPTVLDDVAFGPLNLGLTPDEARTRAQETMAALGLYGFEDRLTHRLSGGEKKLVSLAGVMAMRPQALLLDEPTNGLDPETRSRIIDILNGLDTTLVVISHDWDFLDQTATSFYTIKDGRMVREDDRTFHTHVHSHRLGDLPHRHRP
ncbi:energy-coupling factor ABC transporter ATP-binding protein [Desulfolutivibrio sulfoxidireducens]|uniref:energy-coupling factor ABC transporter ATP-binding protein n=1 Tax=Desulfolutivibrio sulfoxidireducens TaxID=2773299 RepID=UPI00159E4F27|nr:ABC transporter ATP-binding protein [Desulfolutivibrio sulfoxidireducens]QLA19939.1 ATP-binding cassette domain-containing protein [Desulfolutivibrio sulfoxidireducens]